MNAFVGQYEHQMDSKGRISLPAAYRRGGDGERFVLLQWEPEYLTLFPDWKWSEVQRNLLDYRRSGALGFNHVRLIIASAVEVSPDKQGRILVPASLQSGAGLSGTVLMCGNIDRVELWDPARYQSSVQEQATEVAKFAHKLFG